MQLCVKNNLPKKFRKKEELVKRLQDFHAQPTHQVPCKEFFQYTHQRWKAAKKDKTNRAEWFQDTATNLRNELSHDPDTFDLESTEGRKKTFTDLEWIMEQPNSGAEMLAYYQRGKNAWLEVEAQAESS